MVLVKRFRIGIERAGKDISDKLLESNFPSQEAPLPLKQYGLDTQTGFDSLYTSYATVKVEMVADAG